MCPRINTGKPPCVSDIDFESVVLYFLEQTDIRLVTNAIRTAIDSGQAVVRISQHLDISGTVSDVVLQLNDRINPLDLNWGGLQGTIMYFSMTTTAWKEIAAEVERDLDAGEEQVCIVEGEMGLILDCPIPDELRLRYRIGNEKGDGSERKRGRES